MQESHHELSWGQVVAESPTAVKFNGDTEQVVVETKAAGYQPRDGDKVLLAKSGVNDGWVIVSRIAADAVIGRQTGTVSDTFDGTSFDVTFPVAYDSAPRVQVTSVSGAHRDPVVRSVSTTGFTVAVYYWNGSAVVLLPAANPFQIYWSADPA